MKIMTVLGTRPEIIRLSRIIHKLDQFCEHTLVHTGQNYDRSLSDIFFDELEVQKPDFYLSCQGETAMGQVGQILQKTEEILLNLKPDRLLLLGDTNSALCAIPAKRLGIPVYHMEAGNRCYDDRVPEETNRRIIDHSSDILMPYTQNSKTNLLKEGFGANRVYVTGNPIKEVIDHYMGQVEQSNVLQELQLNEQNFFLVTLHRSENVDDEERCQDFFSSLQKIYEEHQVPIICSLHPRTANKLEKFSIKLNPGAIKLCEPFGFFDFIKLEKTAQAVLSDSGTVQEECTLFKVPCVTLRDVTERPETLECGSNILSGVKNIPQALRIALNSQGQWQAPEEYLAENVSETVLKILLSYQR